MKKLIVLSVVFALVAVAAFAVDLGGNVTGSANVMQGSSEEDSDVTVSGGFNALRIEGGGEAEDGKFGGWFRYDVAGGVFLKDAAGIAWWKPIEQFKLALGGNPDGIWGKEGVTGWSLNQKANDGIALGTGNIWGWGETVSGLQTRFAFFHGFDDARVYMEIKPVDMLGINVAIPFIAKSGETAEDVFKATIAQLDLNFDFGNIAITYNGSSHFGDPAIFAYFGGSFGALGLDVGIGYHLTSDSDDPSHPFFAGLGVKYAADAFGIKFRTALGIPAEDDQGFAVLFDVVPYYAFNDNVTAFFNAGIGITAPSKAALDAADAAGADAPETVAGWYINPYLRVGAEWGPSFYIGLQISSDGKKVGDDPAIVKWAVPIGITVGF